MPKLYCVMLGGRAPRCNIELHDIVFVVGDTLAATYPQLKHKWFGEATRLHIDAFVELSAVDGYQIELQQDPPKQQALALFCVNFGAYQPGVFGELHQVSFYVAPSKTEALTRAKSELLSTKVDPHCDDNINIGSELSLDTSVDDLLGIKQVDQYYLHLSRLAKATPPLNIECGYRKILP